MKLPQIDGRECVPVRLLPFLTNWRPLSPDVVARLFSWRDEWRKWSISTFRLSRDGTVHELAPSAWDSIDDDLTILAQRLKRQESFEFEKYPKWRRRSLKALPAGVFVWRDELVADYSRTFGRQKFVTLRPDARAFTEAELEAELELITRLCMKRNPSKEDEAAIEKFEQDAEQSVIVRPGDGELNFASPLVSPNDERIIFEGFESISAIPMSAPKPLQRWPAQEQAVLAKLRVLGYDPMALPNFSPGKSSPAKQAVKRSFAYGDEAFEKAWKRLSSNGDIRYASP